MYWLFLVDPNLVLIIFQYPQIYFLLTADFVHQVGLGYQFDNI